MGVVNEAFTQELHRVVEDVKDRPHDEHARRVSINFIVKPADPHGDNATVECEVIASVPKRVTRPYDMRIQANGQLAFQSESPENSDQMDLDDARGKK